MSSFWTVVAFTIGNKVRTKSFVITTIIIAAILSVGVNLPYLIDKFSSDEPDRIGYASSTEDQLKSSVTPSLIASRLEAAFAKQEEPDYAFVQIPGQGSAEADEKSLNDALSKGDIDAYLTFVDGAEEGTFFPAIEIRSDKPYSDSAVAEIQAAVQAIKTEFALQGLGLTEEQQKTLFSQAVVSSVEISTEDGTTIADGSEKKSGAVYGSVYVILFLLFMTIMGTGQLIASEITAEKSSRVMEVLVTSVSPLKQMFGKILGMFVVGLVQTGAFIVVVAVNLAMPHNESALGDIGFRISDVPVDVFIYALLYYLIGYFLYATLYAGVGSLVSRTEDLGQAVMPLMFLSLGGFYIGMFGLNGPDTMIVKVASFIPFFSPYAMFMRIGMTEVPFWQIAISLATLIVVTLAAGWLSAKIYRTGVLLYGKRPTIKELRKAMKAYKL